MTQAMMIEFIVGIVIGFSIGLVVAWNMINERYELKERVRNSPKADKEAA